MRKRLPAPNCDDTRLADDWAVLGPRHSVVAFTLIELLVVISIIGLLAALVVGLATKASVAGRENKIKAQLNELVTAIEAYKTHTGHYPPDHGINQTPVPIKNSVSNQLYYELTGTLIVNNQFQSQHERELLSSQDVKNAFAVEGFVNASPDEKKIQSFIDPKEEQIGEISDTPDVDVFVVPVPWPLNRTDQPVAGMKGVNPWHYISTGPTNNPTSFDLWAEYPVGNKIRVISNWKPDPFEKP